MRALGRLTLFAVVSSGTITCLARAQPTRVSAELIDPWAERRAPVVVHNPWQAQLLRNRLPLDIVIIDPWANEAPRLPAAIETVELVDPWRDAPQHPPPTADFSIVDPWSQASRAR
jgi:hypothetical protein